MISKRFYKNELTQNFLSINSYFKANLSQRKLNLKEFSTEMDMIINTNLK